MKLSVLIPAIPSRWLMAVELYNHVLTLAGSKPVEVLMLMDNKRRTIGKKREALVQIARGDYVAFVDDDDWIAPEYFDQILPATLSARDVIVFNTHSTINGTYGVAQHSLKFDNEEFSADGFRRKPWQMHAWRRTIAQAHSFPDLQYGEDWGWCQKLCAEAKTEIRVEGPLYFYRYSDALTEAR